MGDSSWYGFWAGWFSGSAFSFSGSQRPGTWISSCPSLSTPSWSWKCPIWCTASSLLSCPLFYSMKKYLCSFWTFMFHLVAVRWASWILLRHRHRGPITMRIKQYAYHHLRDHHATLLTRWYTRYDSTDLDGILHVTDLVVVYQTFEEDFG